MPPRTSSAKPAAPRRRRRDAEAARQAILDATERRLVRAGPSGIRLQEVAADAGVSHPTVLHHFGSREALVKAVITQSIESIYRDLVGAIEGSTGDIEGVVKMLDGVFDALTTGGHGRVMMWLALEGHPIDRTDVRLSDVVDAAHALRKARRQGKGRAPRREDTANAIVLAALAVMGSAVLGRALFENAGLEGDDATEARFRTWLAHLLYTHLEGAG